MKRVLVRYKVKAARAEENERLIKAVFEELTAKRAEGIRYASFMLQDGLSFVHIASIEASEGNLLSETEAFKAFQAEIRDRCEEPPVAVDLDEIDSYRLFD